MRSDNDNDWRGGDTVTVSAKLAQLLKDASIGLTDSEVMARCNIRFATWRRALSGQIVSDKMLLSIAAGLEIDAAPLIQAAHEVKNQPVDPANILIAALEMQPLTREHKRILLQKYRDLVSEEEEASQNAA